MKTEQFTQNKLEYSFSRGDAYVTHNVDQDLHIFCLWEKARSHEEVILSYLKEKFKVIRIVEVTWTQENVGLNFSRLYGNPPTATSSIIGDKSRASKVGTGPFLVVIVKDEIPCYTYDKTFSGKIEIVNKNVAEAKKYFRQITGGGYRVHSSNSIGEFFRDATLIFGPKDLMDILKHPADNQTTHFLNRDLCGHSGWDNFETLFDFLRFTACYVILRNFEYLPFDFFANDRDLDVLCDNANDFAALVNGNIKTFLPGKRTVLIQVAGNSVPIDIRYVGDNYYPGIWERKILERCDASEHKILIPRRDDYFFSLLYHAKIHKRSVKPVYTSRLNQIKVELGLGDAFNDDITTDEKAALILGGYLKREGYAISIPTDKKVIINRAFVERVYSDSVLNKNDDKLSFSIWFKGTPLFKLLIRNKTVLSLLRKVWYLPKSLK